MFTIKDNEKKVTFNIWHMPGALQVSAPDVYLQPETHKDELTI